MTTPLQRGVLGAGVALVLACALAACGSSPAPKHHSSPKRTTTTTSTTAVAVVPSTTTTSAPSGVAVPNIVGLKITPAHYYLHEAGFLSVPLNDPCNRGTLSSQSVVLSLSIPGSPPSVSTGATPLVPGTLRPKGSTVGITWSGCFPNGSAVPAVTGLTFDAAVKLLRTAGLTWSCYSEAPVTTTTAAKTPSSGPKPTTTTTTLPPLTVLTQSPPPNTVLAAGTPVRIEMRHCLQ
jgi:beta-lactam-binding protein with PASTA domain